MLRIRSHTHAFCAGVGNSSSSDILRTRYKRMWVLCMVGSIVCFNTPLAIGRRRIGTRILSVCVLSRSMSTRVFMQEKLKISNDLKALKRLGQVKRCMGNVCLNFLKQNNLEVRHLICVSSFLI